MALSLRSSVALLSVVAASTASLGQPPAERIPELHGSVLTGSAVDLPQNLEGKSGVLIVGFSQSSRAEVTEWGRRLAGEYRDSPTIVYYEMPVIAAVPRLLRGWVLKKLNEGVPDRAKSHCLPVLDHEAEWKHVAGFAHDEDAYVLVVDEAGTVLWKTEGSLTDSRLAEVKQHLGQ